jgi:hypothetical protein
VPHTGSPPDEKLESARAGAAPGPSPQPAGLRHGHRQDGDGGGGFARPRSRLPRARLLFVAHREEILAQSRATFAHALRDGSFGELWVGGSRPHDFEHVFASIQSLNASGLEHLAPDHFDVVIVDEFHHAAAQSYERLLERLNPVELLGLTATPERSDGVSVLHWFDDRISAPLMPFANYGIADDFDRREVLWRPGGWR